MFKLDKINIDSVLFKFVNIFLYNLGILKKENAKYFDCPRNILCVPGFFKDPERFAIVVLDNIGFHVFDEDGSFYRFEILFWAGINLLG